MHVVDARNLNQAAPKVVRLLQAEKAYRRESRNGPVVTLDEPVCMTLDSPFERVLYWEGRKNNPFLDFFDGLFALSRNNDADFMLKFSKQFEKYMTVEEPDDLSYTKLGYPAARFFGGHYGTRLRTHFYHGDQLDRAIRKLDKNADDRRAVISLWGHDQDYEPESVDVPCNVMLLPKVTVEGDLALTVINRSNDIAWGYLGVNPVQFSFIQEYIASALERSPGELHMITNNLHGYEEFGPWKWMRDAVSAEDTPEDIYTTREYRPFPMIAHKSELHGFLWDVDNFVTAHGDFGTVTEPRNFQTQYFKHVVIPMYVAWAAIKELPKQPSVALAYEINTMTNHILSPDWCAAVKMYVSRKVSANA